MDRSDLTILARFVRDTDPLPRPVVLVYTDGRERVSLELAIERPLPRDKQRVGKKSEISACRRIYAGPSAARFAELLVEANAFCSSKERERS